MQIFFARNPPCAILKGCSADLGTACLDLSRLISSHIILFILPAVHYSFYQPNNLLLFLPMALRLFPAVQSHLNSSVYLPTTAGRTGLCSHLSLNWLMLLAWWGCCSGWVQASSSNLYEWKLFPLYSFCSPLFPTFFSFSFFFDSCRGKQLYGSVLGH